MTAPTPTLVDRYVYAATRSLPEDQRRDIADELRGSIADRVASLMQERPGITPEEAERAAVAELGDPERLSAEYAGRPQHVIGPRLYPVWWRTLRVILSVAVPAVVTIGILVDVLQGEHIGAVIGSAIGGAINVGVHIAFWTTLVFFILERTMTPEDLTESLGEWTPDRLPQPSRARGSLAELVGGVAFLAFLAAALVWQQLSSPLQEAGRVLPILDPALWSFWLPLILVAIAAEMAFEVVKYRRGWTTAMAALNVALGALFAAPWVYLAATGRLLNPLAVAEIQTAWAEFNPGVVHTIVTLSAVLIWLWDSVDGFRKARGVSVGC